MQVHVLRKTREVRAEPDNRPEAGRQHWKRSKERPRLARVDQKSCVGIPESTLFGFPYISTT